MSETVKMIKAKFNDVEYELPAGLTVLQAAQQIGVPIPYFCWHKHLSISGNCRMCLVETKPGPPKPVVACGTPLNDGMEVFTETDTIKNARRAVLQFLLLNHPLDCPVCDEAYECKLQDYTYAYGPEVSRFVPFHDKKRIYKREDLGKMWVEMNRCIECTRCVRFLKEVAGEYELERMHRGHNLKIHTYKQAFESDFALNAADLCPVGALEDKKYHFSARNWDLIKVPSICPSCSIGCNIEIHSLDGRIRRLLPRENEAVNACWMCDAGRHNFDFVADNRLSGAQARLDADLEAVELDAALDFAHAKLEEVRSVHGGETIGVLTSPWMTNEELFAAKKLGTLLGAGKVGVLTGYNHRPVVPVMSDILPKTLVSDDKSPNSTGARLLNLTEGEEEFTFAHELITAIEDGKIKSLILFHEDLLVRPDFDSTALRKALALLDFLLVVSTRPLTVAAQAHLVLPAQTWAEKNGTFTNHGKRVQRIRKAVTPAQNTWDELSLVTALGRRFEADFGYETFKDAFAAMAAEEAAFAGLTLKGVGQLGTVVQTEKPSAD